MNIEKVKEALEIGLNYVENSGWTRSREKEIIEIKEALAELEKPAEDAESLLSMMFRDIREIGYITEPLRLTNESHGACVALLTRYAESYHAKKCAECGNVVCPDCKGLGYTAEHDPSGNAHDEKGNCLGCCPIQVQCEKCNGTGKI